MSSKYALNPHALVRFLEKDAKDFTKDDIIRYVTENEIEMINFRYPGADGRLKTLNFIINSLDHLDNILTCGERVDGSSLFPYIEAGSSDLYVLPRYRTAFLNPFSEGRETVGNVTGVHDAKGARGIKASDRNGIRGDGGVRVLRGE